MALKAHLEPISCDVEQRRHPRRTLRIETSGTLFADGSGDDGSRADGPYDDGVPSDGLEANVRVHNLSAAGLLIETDLPLDIGDVLAIDLPGVGPVGAEIVWKSDRLHGCAFQQALGEAALAEIQSRGAASASPEVHSMHSTGTGVATESNEAEPLAVGETLGARLARCRRDRGLTLAQVADALNVSKPTVWAWEKGKARPLPERMEAIAQTLGVDRAMLEEPGSRETGGSVIEECRLRIATAYGTSASRVRIMIEV